METLQDARFLTELLRTFIDTFTIGSTRLEPYAMSLLVLFFTLELTLMGIWFMFRHDVDLSPLIFRVLGVAVLGGLLRLWPVLTREVAHLFIFLGTQASGAPMSEATFSDVARIADYGLLVTLAALKTAPTGWEALLNPVGSFITGVTALVLMAAFFALAGWCFLAQLEYYLTATVAMALIPFAGLKYTAFLAEKAFAAVCAAGVQLMALACVLGVALPVIERIQMGPAPGIREYSLQCLAACLLLFLSWRIHKIAHAIVGGSPQLTLAEGTRSVHTVIHALERLSSTMTVVREAMRDLVRTQAPETGGAVSRRRG